VTTGLRLRALVPEDEAPARAAHATEILHRALAVARGLGLERVLVTCDEDNVASARVIERNGGVFESLVDRPGHPRKRRYWFG
jgi:predicted acetyltransferase